MNSEIFHSNNKYVTVGNKYMKDFGKKAIIISQITKCKSFVLLGNVTKPDYKWL